MHLILCIHNHQPVGNMEFILEEAYHRAYMPFFEVLKDFPQVKINLHFSGYLFTWLQAHKPDYIDLLKSMVTKGQLEIISGGMYEPIVALIPEDDAIAQIGIHADLMERTFGRRPRGMWLAERVYESNIPGILSRAGMEFTIVDDNHFKAVGMKDKDLFGYYLSEYEGRSLSIFPGLEALRYAIPFKPMEAVDEYLRGVEKQEGALAVFGDDGEKFGLWPGTYFSVYEEGWLREFFAYLTENQNWLKTATFGEYMALEPPRGLVYLDNASYKEMGEWALPSDLTNSFAERLSCEDPDRKAFLRGGYFKNFLVKYPESNDMHKKMLALSRKAKRNETAREHLYMGQANDSYWHGVFGGLYLPHLRASVYQHLIEGEKALDPGKPFVDALFTDANFDGRDEAVISNDLLKGYFLISQGGTLYELDYKPCAVNVMATLQRRYEGYHERVKKAVLPSIADETRTIHDLVIAKEQGLELCLHYDWYRRASFVDHVMDKDVSLSSFFQGRYVEPGDFVKEPYEASFKKGRKGVELLLTRNGHYWKERDGIPLTISKRFSLGKGENRLFAEYEIGGSPEGLFYLGIEFNFGFLGSGGDRYMEVEGEKLPLTTSDILGSTGQILLHDPYQHVDVSILFDKADQVWTFPVEIVSLSENGFERNYQSTMVMPVWEVDLTKGSRRIALQLSLSKTDNG